MNTQHTNTQDFNNKIGKAKIFEDASINYIQQALNYYGLQYKELIDTSLDSDYMDADIDFYVMQYGGIPLNFEVKCDYTMGSSNNIFLEKLHHRKTGDKLGWYYTSDSDYIIYMTDYINQNDIKHYGDFVIFDFLDLKQKIEHGDLECKTKSIWNKADNCFTDCYLIKWHKVLDNCYGYKGNIRHLIIDKDIEYLRNYLKKPIEQQTMGQAYRFKLQYLLDNYDELKSKKERDENYKYDYDKNVNKKLKYILTSND